MSSFKLTILELLKEKDSEFITYGYMSEILNISRKEIEKELNDLRILGYMIESIPHQGIKLIDVPDKIVAEEIRYNLNTRLLGKYIFCYNEIDSTSDTARDLAEKIKEEGIVVFAETQTKGRGRMHKKWVSLEGGLYLSIVLRPENSFKDLAKFYLLSSIALAKAIRKVANVNTLIKWPNDIIVNGKKLAGILAETSMGNKRIEFLILGIGVNVNNKSSKLPKESTTLLNETKKLHSRVLLAKEILKEIEKYYFLFKKEGITSIIKEWQNLSYCLGSRIKIINNKKRLEGEAIGLDEESGALLLRKDNGFIEKILSVDSLKVQKRVD